MVAENYKYIKEADYCKKKLITTKKNLITDKKKLITEKYKY